MAINQRYQLVEVLRDEDSIRSARGQDLTTGQPVEVHLFLNGHSAESKALLRKVVAMTRGGASYLLDFGEEQGTPYVVTRPLGGPFRDWVSNETRRAQGFGGPPPPLAPLPPQQPPQAPPQAPPSNDPFAHMFAQPGAPAAGGPSTQFFQPPPAAPPQQPMYTPYNAPPAMPPTMPPPMQAAPPPPRPSVAMPPLPAPTPPQKAQSMGAVTVEFHRLFADDQGVATMRTPAPVVPPAPVHEAPHVPGEPPAPKPGEFTLMFGGPRPNAPPSGPAHTPHPPPPPAAVAPPSPPSLPPSAAPVQAGQGQPVAFQLAFNPPGAAPKPAVPESDLAVTAGGPPPPRVAAPPPPPAPPPQPPPATGVGEFTRMFEAPGSAPSPHQAPSPSPTLQAPPAPHAPPPQQPPAYVPAPAPAAPVGEFTRMFEAPGQASAPPPPQQPPAYTPPQPPPPQAQKPAPPPAPPAAPLGEFTRMFEAPGQAPPQPASFGGTIQHPAAAPPPQPQAYAPPQPPAARPAPPAPPPQGQAAGEFTQMFQHPTAQTPPIPNPPAAGQSQKFTPPPMPAGAPPSNRMTMVEIPSIPASAFEPNRPSMPPPQAPSYQPPALQSGVTVEFHRLFEDSKPAGSGGQPPPPQPQQGGGEFTRMFQSAGGNSAPMPPPHGGPAKPGGYVTAREGESTQMFQSPLRAPSGPPAPPPRSAPPPPQGGQPQGEFTQMFHRNQNQNPGGLPPSGGEPGEFTRQFMNPLAPGATPGRQDYQMAAMPQQPAGPVPPPKVNEFEELFGGVKAQQRPAPFQPPFGGGGQSNPGGLSATSQFTAAPSGSTPAPQAAPLSSPLAPASGGSSYTQFMKAPGPSEGFGLGQQAPPPQHPPMGAPAAATPQLAAKKGVPPIVWIGAGLLVFLIIAIVIVFAFMKK